MTYRTRIPGTAGKELGFDSRTEGQEAVEAVAASMPVMGGTGAPIVVGNRRRREPGAFAAALGPICDANHGITTEEDRAEPAPD